ncbi:MAG: hypothetical protein JO335_11295 [Sphingomonas sp.]|nr:hypothetical protein [Sphingomonas sp.]
MSRLLTLLSLSDRLAATGWGEPIAMVWRRWREEVGRNPRLHYGVLAILAILVLGSWLGIEDSHRRAQSASDTASQYLVTLRRLAGQTEWRKRSETVGSLRAQIENRLWDVESDGLAQANFQDLIAKFAERNKLEATDIRVEIVAAASASTKLRQMTASFSGRFDGEKLQNFLADLARDRHLLVVDRLRIETIPLPKYVMAVTTYLRAGAAASAGATAAPRS